MVAILIAIITAFIMGTESVIDWFLDGLEPLAFYAERYMSEGILTGTSINFEALFDLFFDFGIALIILKTLKKGFEVYVLWVDGDPDLDPLNFVVNFLRALVVSISFPILYGWMADICHEVLDTMMELFNVETGPSLIDMILDSIAGSLFQAVAGLVLVVLWLIMYLQFVMRGIEILIMRIGVPIACTGLIDSDKGVFAPYMKKFFQNLFTVIIQLALIKLSVTIMGMGEIIFSIAVAMVAIRTPRFLQEFMLFSSGGSSLTNTIYHTSRIYQMAKTAINKAS